MAIHYSIFFKSDSTMDQVKRSLNGVEGVETAVELSIAGLLSVECSELDSYSRQLMREEYGKFGLDVNREIYGKYDKSTDPEELVTRLFCCCAVLIRKCPEEPLSLMCEERFYLWNNCEKLILSPIWASLLPTLPALFRKPIEIRNLQLE